MVNDIISDMLTKIRNANSAKHELVEISYTKITESITRILKEEEKINFKNVSCRYLGFRIK
jgi:small subunit ribosomal protein S8